MAKDFFVGHATSSLVAYYNEVGPEVGRKPITKFENREVAERRCEELRQEVSAKRRAAATANGKITEQADDAPAVTEEPAARHADGETTNMSHGTYITDAFNGVKISPNRQPLLAVLLAHPGSYVSSADLAQAVYGDASKIGPLGMVIKGLQFTIDKHEVKVELRKQKVGKSDISWGLFKPEP